jgi:hypothetical protein
VRALARDGTTFKANTRHAVEREAKARAASGYRPDPRYRDVVQDALRVVSAGARQP